MALLAAGNEIEAPLATAQRAAALSVQRSGAFAALPEAAELGSLLAAATASVQRGDEVA